MDNPGFPLVLWTIRLAVACYAMRVLMDFAAAGSLRMRRSVWTAGLVCYVAHVVAAFHFVHDWSHAAAWEATARETWELTGWNSGAGLWANYAFTVLWFVDAVAWWVLGPDYPQRFSRVSMVFQSAFAFIVFNATVVFGPAFWRLVAMAFALAIAVALIWRARHLPLQSH